MEVMGLYLIPFMAMLGKQFPEAQFVITGVLGPQSNAHGPNELLHIPFAKKKQKLISLLDSRRGPSRLKTLFFGAVRACCRRGYSGYVIAHRTH